MPVKGSLHVDNAELVACSEAVSVFSCAKIDHEDAWLKGEIEPHSSSNSDSFSNNGAIYMLSYYLGAHLTRKNLKCMQPVPAMHLLLQSFSQ